jgi:hypothetical protein
MPPGHEVDCVDERGACKLTAELKIVEGSPQLEEGRALAAGKGERGREVGSAGVWVGACVGAKSQQSASLKHNLLSRANVSAVFRLSRAARVVRCQSTAVPARHVHPHLERAQGVNAYGHGCDVSRRPDHRGRRFVDQVTPGRKTLLDKRCMCGQPSCAPHSRGASRRGSTVVSLARMW